MSLQKFLAVEYETTDPTEQIRALWVYDELHEVRGSFGYNTEAENEEAEAEVLRNLERGTWVALGCIIQRKHSPVTCGACGHTAGGDWEEIDSLWGIVIAPNEKELTDFAAHSMSFPEFVKRTGKPDANGYGVNPVVKQSTTY